MLATRHWAIALALALLCACLYLATRDGRLPFTHTTEIPAESIKGARDGYSAGMAQCFGPGKAALYAGLEEPHRPLSGASWLLGWSRTFHYLDALVGNRFPELTTRVEWSRLKPDGRIAGCRVHFTQAGDADPKAAGLILRAESSPRVPAWVTGVVAFACLAVMAVAAARSWRSRGILREHFPGLVISMVMVATLWAGAELYLRTKMPFVHRIWPGQVVPVAGLVLRPGEVLRHTNNLEFWIEERSNSLGFLDRDPVIPKPAGTFRIVVLGDSFIEAAQVPLAQKFQVLLEAQLRSALPGRAIEVFALSYSGTGQSAQLGFYEVFGKRLAPDLIINVATRNDLANNSPLLESVRHGWDPRHAPRLFYDVDPGSGGFRRQDVDLQWEGRVLFKTSGNPKRDAKVRLDLLRRDPEYRAALADWRYPEDLDMDEMFCAASMPPVFEQAQAITAHVFGVLAEAARRDDARLLVVINDSATTLCDIPRSPRAIRRDGAANRLKQAAESAGVEVYDMYPAFAANGDVAQARFPIDVHWNGKGHAWAARATADYLLQRRDLLDPRP